ncbi:hypothetical protein HDG34_002561 [Paraburkholderia sp. HC6.4b]|uniref:hypothetical protein n=1 Tax=unclassified Paraburkholderia TaxID=2615204 RepID=UPI00161BFE1E|nr:MULTISPECIES: hypothetical protein [unclassified Paraburkholderia]MBB5408624.1 hypothetical protein [Paraburkholderia sp. HC6.4b]MBB5450456.1 hypothetical protein [Paraburkholderia sp. Kb1A]
MINLSKFLIGVAIILGGAAPGFAGEAILFDDPSLVGYREGGRIYGFYDAENEKFSCSFLFFQDDKGSHSLDIDGYTDTKLLTFVPGNGSFKFSNRDKSFDIRGDLYRNGNEWVIKTSSGQAGCENATGGFIFDLGSMEAAKYYAVKKIPAIGIRLVNGKSSLYDYRDGKFLAKKSYLTKWNVVVILETHNQFSLVRFADPRLNVESYGRVTTGWVHTSDLVNPFPPASKP